MAAASLTTELTRSEEELQSRVMRFLYLKDVPGIEDIYADVDGAVVTVRGRVPSERDRRLCLEFCRRVPGVLHVRNELEIDEESRQAERGPVRG